MLLADTVTTDFVNVFKAMFPDSKIASMIANVFVFGDFNGHHKDWLTYCGGTDRPGKFSYNLKQPYSDS